MIGILAGQAEEAMVVLKGIIWGVMVLILWEENVSSLRGGNLGEAMEAGEAVMVSSGVGAVVVEMEGGVSLPPEGVRCLVVGLVGSLSRIFAVRLDDNKGKGKQVMGDKSGGDAKGKKLDDSNQGNKGKKDSSDSTYGWQTKMAPHTRCFEQASHFTLRKSGQPPEDFDQVLGVSNGCWASYPKVYTHTKRNTLRASTQEALREKIRASLVSSEV
ncbi:hypothetical protein GUJ93_ZPchr0007g5859 [Zizania palustris]|uniref:Uncharacterized protein n=1 Tax=Zizania palustris TaxID=103762 RepID=A0A8J5W4L0_ZIZPA|nr:hypothetical protein GUJ93_ZPchr0007g5859 [Zizania palustris]